MKERAVETAEALKAAAEALGFAPDSDRFFTFVNSQFGSVFFSPSELDNPNTTTEAKAASASD
jgi:hypothetical protein